MCSHCEIVGVCWLTPEELLKSALPPTAHFLPPVMAFVFISLKKSGPVWFLPISRALLGDASWHKKVLNCLQSQPQVQGGDVVSLGHKAQYRTHLHGP